MSVIARDGVASDHLVYAWPFPIGPECDVTCRDDEQVVMCPSWIVGDRLGPGRHRYFSPNPAHPVSAYFVLLAPVEVPFDMTTSFILPMTGQPIRLRANGSIQVRCTDPGLLVAQFVGLPFDSINEGVTRSVSRSIERMIARLLTRRVVMAGTPQAVTDAGMKAQIVEELVAYNPAAGAVFGIELTRFGHITIAADDGSSPYFLRVAGTAPPIGSPHSPAGLVQPSSLSNGNGRGHEPQIQTTLRGQPPAPIIPRRTSVAPGEEVTGPKMPDQPRGNAPQSVASGEIGGKRKTPQMGVPIQQGPSASGPAPVVLEGGRPVVDAIRPRTDSSGGAQMATSSGEITAKPPKAQTGPSPSIQSPHSPAGSGQSPPAIPSVPRRAQPIEVPQSPEEITSPAQIPTPVPSTNAQPSRGAIMGIGMSAIGGGGVAGEIPQKIKPGGRVLVPGPNGLMQSATVRQLLQGYYELEVGSSGETIWVPINGVIPDP